MDRFIDRADQLDLLELIYLKSNMDRFIGRLFSNATKNHI